MKWIHNLLKGASLTGALFVFQACYGTPVAPIIDENGVAPMSFCVVSQETGEPLEGVRIRGTAWETSYREELGVTGKDGRCRVDLPYVRNLEGPFLTFEDTLGRFAPKDTVLDDLRDREIVIKMHGDR